MDGPTPRRGPKERKKPKKTLNACRRCRARKIKCSGQSPCLGCTSKRVKCNFDEREKRIIISEEYVIRLQNRVRELEARTSPRTGSTSTLNGLNGDALPAFQYFVDDQETSPVDETFNPIARKGHPAPNQGSYLDSDAPQPLIVNPVLASKSQLLFGEHGHFRYLGNSSTWSFSRQLRNLLNNSGAGSPLNERIPKSDGVFYDVSWRKNNVDLGKVDLPTPDLAEYYATTVSLYIGSLYHCYDLEKFLANLREFYSTEHPNQKTNTGLWHIQMLLVFACGKSILAREATPSGQTGMNYFSQAIEGLPDIRALQQEPILAIEILCLVSLFLEASDIRSAAWGYIGQGIRIALQQGMNREFESGILSEEDYEHRSKLWWTLYIIDRRLTSLMGVPLMIQDADISIPQPVHLPGTSLVFSYHTQLSVEMGKVLHVVYGLEGRLGTKFIAGVQSTLKNLAGMSSELNKNFPLDSLVISGTVTRISASLHMLYHQCIILAIRPVLLCLLESKLQNRTGPSVSDAVMALLRVCVESAVQVLKIVQALKNQTLLDLFLPYDLDAMFSSAFALTVIDSIIPATEGQWGISEAFSVFEHLISRGMAPAVVYQEHLIEMNDFRMNLQRGGQTCNIQMRDMRTGQGNNEPEPDQAMKFEPSVEGGIISSGLNNHREPDSMWSWMTIDNDQNVLQPDAIEAAILGLNYDSMGATLDFDTDNQWLWGDYVAENSIG